MFWKQITPNNQQPSKKKPQNFQAADNPIEIIKDLTTGIAKSTVNDVAFGIAKNVFEQIGLTPKKKLNGTLNPNEDINFENLVKEQKPSFIFEQNPAIRNLEQPVFSSKDVEVQRKIEEILKEIKILAKSVDKINQEVGKVAMTEMPSRAGVYHLNFFEFILKTIRKARENVDDSGICLRLFKSRKGEKEYWSMFKKHGTTFGLSYERSVSTQTG